MDKITQFIGVDISKDKLDFWIPGTGHLCLPNSKKGFRSLIKSIPRNPWFAMEATGCYYQQLAMFLHEKGLTLSVVNPLVIKRFIQMKLQRNKTDKADAKMIWKYACEQPLEAWEPEPAYIEQCKAIYTTIELYLKQGTAVKNKLHSLASKGEKTGLLVRSLKRQAKHLQNEIFILEQEIESIVKENEDGLFTNITSISGIGEKLPCC